ncbi:tetratricopeptide (TPR) repeat protein [Microbacterium resistens]|uniref:Tetratricopeptide (TPR) repeat protein n=1 Tax=Microbacterium resistens TaxID=156977 RepID=A0ABU1SBD5_9MICO|nr:DUF5107 domain-containing protein [Microbacterium resistens]MDR6866927.1 tetratricopeptide (TPR) repeat protein [Microbacterium resistens]
MSATLSVTDDVLPAANLGPVNPLPAVAAMPQAPYEADIAGLPDGIAANLRYGQVSSIHPYLLQDDYGRERTPTPLRVAVLGNDHLRAEFALGLGGRLLSLVDRRTGRDLLYRNAVFQPANLGLRNAWFSGGVEWNIGMRGHWPLTCDPVYAAEVTGPDGEPVLRMWEYERKRGLILQLDATLDADAPALHVRVRIRNPHDRETGMYWWTNIAVAQEQGSRVLAPAARAYQTGYDGALSTVDLEELDASRPATAPAAADFFFDVTGTAQERGEAVRPWIVAVDEDRNGLAHVSTAPLTGRKLFVWGDTTGGRRWCDWLGGATGEYFEIQAGLTTTQYEHLPMPGGATWEWTETFLPIRIDDPRLDSSWSEAVQAAGDRVAQLTDGVGAAASARLDAVADAEPGRLLAEGSPWGSLEAALSARLGEPFAPLPGVHFTPDEPGSPWAALLDGALPDADPSVPPSSYVEGEGWERLLSAAPQTWLSQYHLAVMRHAADDLRTAIAHYEASLRKARSPWALRGLGLALLAIAGEDGESGAGLSDDSEARADAIARLTDAHALAPDCIPLTLELGDALLATGRAAEARALVEGQPDQVRCLGRFRALAVRAALALGDRDEAGRLLEERFEIPDLREGELSMSALWREAFPYRPVPAWYDFEMAPEQGPSSPAA